MSVRTKLILIFLLVSVVPLAALTFISYTNSISSLRMLVQRDSRAAAADIQARVSSLNTEIQRRVADVTELPELQELDAGRPLDRQASARVAQAMQQQVSDRWSLFSDLEFVPGMAPPAPPPRPAGGRPVPPPPPVPSPRAAAPPQPEPRQEERSAREGEEGEKDTWSMKIILPDFARLDPAAPGDGTPTVKEYRLDFVDGAPTEETLEALSTGVVENLVRLPGFLLQTGESGSIKLRNLGEDLREGMAASLPGVESPEFMRLLDEAEREGSQSIVLPVQGEAGVVGNVVARIRPDRVLSQVFEGMAPSAGEIAFAVDPAGEIHARSPEDLRQLHELGLATAAAPGPEGQVPRPTVPDPEELASALRKPDWIAVIQQNAETGYAFGVVRQVATEIQDIRQATLFNLFLGFILIGLAGSGIIVFSRRMTLGLEALTEGARRIAEGDLGHRIAARRRDELGQLAGAFNDMAADLAVTRKRLLEQERVRRELEIAREIQRESLPRRPYSSDDLEIFGRSIPSNEVGGDFYNFVPLAEGRLAVLIGDVSGKGVPAALMMAEVQATLRTLLQYQHDVGRVAKLLNTELCRTKPDNIYLTLFLGILDREAGTLTYVNAGHSPPFLLKGGDGALVELPSSTRPVGLYEEFDTGAEIVPLREGDLICLYTDGVVESTGTDGTEEFFGRHRVEEAIRQCAGGSLPMVMDEVARRLTGFHGSDSLEDDATLVLVRIGWDEARRSRPARQAEATAGTGLPH